MKLNMKIKSVEIYKADIAFNEPFKIAIMEFSAANSIIVRIHTDSGIYGMGEANPSTGITGDDQEIGFAGAVLIAKHILGKSPLDIEARMTEINHLLLHNSCIRSAFDMALYDIVGKASGLPLYHLLGGGSRTLVTDQTIGIDHPEVMAEKAMGFCKEGFPAIKVKLGTNKEDDINRVKAIRESIGDQIPIRIDANQGWNFSTAVAVLRQIEKYEIEYCEQPLKRWDYENMGRLRQITTIPIMADESLFDEHDAFKLAQGGYCDLFNIKLAKSGGLHTALKINAIAESAGIPCMVGCMNETRLGLTAAAHLVSARPNIRFADLDGHFFHQKDLATGGCTYRGGEITLPDAPGIGADIDSGFLDSCEKIQIS